MLSAIGIIILVLCVRDSQQHGYLADPPQRSSLWRENPEAPVNYNDNQLYCGGRENLRLMGDRCGTCGDPFQGPRDNEAGGIYANGIIARNYSSAQRTIPVQVVLTAYHKGYYEFKICPHNNPRIPVSQRCLDEYPLDIKEGSSRYPKRYYPKHSGAQWLNLFLPRGMECSQCVLQWRYRTGNSWGVDKNGRGCMGCGNQEEFWNCADIQIKSHFSPINSRTDFHNDDSEEDNQPMSSKDFLNHWFSPDTHENIQSWNQNKNSDSDESEDKSSRARQGSAAWSRNLFNDFSDLQGVGSNPNSLFKTVSPSTINPWLQITTRPPIVDDPWSQLTGQVTNRHNSISGRVNGRQTSTSGRVTNRLSSVSGRVNGQQTSTSGRVTNRQSSVSGRVNDRQTSVVSGRTSGHNSPVSGQLANNHKSGQVVNRHDHISGQVVNRHDHISNSINLQNPNINNRQGRLSDSWTVLWQPTTPGNPIHNGFQSQNPITSGQIERQPASREHKQPNRLNIAPISPLTTLLGAIGSQVQFLFLPKDDLQRLRFF